ncbi:magnesium ion transporter [Saitoella coloradoensis]
MAPLVTKKPDIKFKEDEYDEDLDDEELAAKQMKAYCLMVDHTGKISRISGPFDRAKLIEEHEIEPRDLRKIDTDVHNIIPSITIRHKSVIVSTLALRALINAKATYFYVPDASLQDDITLPTMAAVTQPLQLNPSDTTPPELRSHTSRTKPTRSLLPETQEKILERHAEATELANTASRLLRRRCRRIISHGGPAGLRPMPKSEFEMLALEATLVSVMKLLERSLGNLRRDMEALIEDLEEDVDPEGLFSMLSMSKRVLAFSRRTKLLQSALTNVLHRDLAQNASKHKNNELFDTEESLRRAQLLIETYLKRIDEIVEGAESLTSESRNTETNVNLVMDTMRNNLLALDTSISILTLAISSSALVAGLLGMNLTNYWEGSQDAFLWACSVAVALVVGIGKGGMGVLKGMSRARLMRRLGQGVRHSRRQMLE